ncbi:MAG: hypothetical protein DLM72_04960 [Candidatus Nitrosopolaris wilkensis]|nr:MAG: hypothetical protein DLM72_04960 [Candidatus Nitrosopolaris wilkensis]
MPVPVFFTLTINSITLQLSFSYRLKYIISHFVDFKALHNKLEITCEIHIFWSSPSALVLAYAPDLMTISTSAVFTVIYATGCGNLSRVCYTKLD